nr:ISAzo13 family transposase [Nitrosomonas sp. Nm34]
MAESHCQQDPTFRTALSYTRLTVAAALDRLRAQGFPEDGLPSPSTMAKVLNRNGYRLRKVVKAKPQKLPETDAIFANIADKDGKPIADPAYLEGGQVMRLGIECKATVKIGAYSRSGKTRADIQVDDHDRGCEEKQVPFGIVEEDSGQLPLTFGSAFKTSGFIVDGLEDGWQAIPREKQAVMTHIQLKVDNGRESSRVRTRFLKRMVEFADATGKIIQLLYYPPYHSKYSPIERGWEIWEQHWDGAQRVDTATMLAWAKSMIWRGSHPMVKLSRRLYQKGVSLSRKAMREIEARLERNPLLPKWDILIRPA